MSITFLILPIILIGAFLFLMIELKNHDIDDILENDNEKPYRDTITDSQH